MERKRKAHGNAGEFLLIPGQSCAFRHAGGQIEHIEILPSSRGTQHLTVEDNHLIVSIAIDACHSATARIDPTPTWSIRKSLGPCYRFRDHVHAPDRVFSHPGAGCSVLHLETSALNKVANAAGGGDAVADLPSPPHP